VKTFGASVLLGCLALLCPIGGGCVTKGHAKAQADAAYLAGQRDALARLQQTQPQTPSVRVEGPVNKSVVPWTSGLTLGQAIMAAEYQGVGDPSEIFVIRSGMAHRIDIRGLFNGDDPPLQAGDVVHIVAVPPPSPR
jgi:hypothetical protein